MYPSAGVVYPSAGADRSSVEVDHPSAGVVYPSGGVGYLSPPSLPAASIHGKTSLHAVQVHCRALSSHSYKSAWVSLYYKYTLPTSS